MISTTLTKSIERSLTQHFGSPLHIIRFTPIGGGCINDARRMQTSAGDFFVKFNDAKLYPGMFAAEAHGLNLLRSAKALKIPEVILFDEAEGKSFLILEYIEPEKRKARFWEDFGRNFAALHQHHASSFGLDRDNYIGSLPQSNKQHSSWIEFFIVERLEKQIQLARKAGAISNSTIEQFNQLFKRLPELIPDEKPSLLHGDLWSGNFMTAADGSACLIDPAVYYGHREMDLAMTKLFGGFDRTFYDDYHEAFPLAAGFDSRADLHNLYPLMVHVNLFGGGYLSQVKDILSPFA